MESFKYRPMFVIAFTALLLMLVAFASGHLFACGVVSFALGAVLVVILLAAGKLRTMTVTAYFSAAMLFAGLLSIGQAVFVQMPVQQFAGTRAQAVAVVTQDDAEGTSAGKHTVRLRSLDGVDVNANAVLYLKEDWPFEAGDTIAFSAAFTDANAGKRTAAVRTNLAENIYLSAYLTGTQDIAIVSSGEHTLRRRMHDIREWIAGGISAYLPKESGAVAIAMLLGDTQVLSAAAKRNFSVTGVSHLFAVSGVHLSVWVLSLYALLRKLRLRRTVNAGLAIAFTVFFMLLTGLTPSVCRAGVMLIILMLGRIVREESDALNSLGIACFCMLAVNPASAIHVSLLLSLSATFGIVTLYPYLYGKLAAPLRSLEAAWLRNGSLAAVSVILISVCAGIFTLPVTAFCFGRVSVIAPITNLLVSYAATVCMLCGGLTALLQTVAVLARPCALICGLAARYVLAITNALAQCAVTTVSTDSVFFHAAELLILTGVAVIFLVTKRPAVRLRAVTALVLGVSLLTGSAFGVYTHGLTRLTLWNVGDGTMLCVTHGMQKFVLGCGGSDLFASDEAQTMIGDHASCLLVPNENRWNSAAFANLTRNCDFDRIILGSDDRSLRLIAPNAEVVSRFHWNPWSDASVEFYNDGKTAYAYCVFGGTDVWVIFDCEESYTPAPPYCNADVLICAYYPPAALDLQAFQYIAVSSVKEICDSIRNEHPNAPLLPLCDYTNVTLSLRESGNIHIDGESR